LESTGQRVAHQCAPRALPGQDRLARARPHHV